MLGGWDPMSGGDPIQHLDWGEGGWGGNIIPGCFYGLNRNGYGNVIFSVSLLTFHVGGGWGPIPGTVGGVL